MHVYKNKPFAMGIALIKQSINHTLYFYMAPPVSISILVLALWVLCIFTHSTTMVVAAKSSALELEAKALLESGWWSSNYTNGSSLSHCAWPGIYCNAGGSVIEIDMQEIYLGDKFRKFNFSSFPNLEFLYLYNSGLQGSIPPEIGTLSKLIMLSLSMNNLTGNLPLSLTNLTQLEYLFIYNNRISGSIPDLLGNLKNLQMLQLSTNAFSGSIPHQLGNLKNLGYLDIRRNKLAGELPPSLANLTQLETFDISSNLISGSIPKE